MPWLLLLHVFHGHSNSDWTLLKKICGHYLELKGFTSQDWEAIYISVFIYFTSTGSSIFLKFLRPTKIFQPRHIYIPKTSAQDISFSKILSFIATICVSHHKHTNRYGSQGFIMAKLLFVHIDSLDRSLSDMQKHVHTLPLPNTNVSFPPLHSSCLG